MHGSLDMALATAIQRSTVVVVCLTEAYCRKLDAASRAPCLVTDNCLKEILWARELKKVIVPVVMEPVRTFGVVATMGLGGFVYADATRDDESAARAVDDLLRQTLACRPTLARREGQRRARRAPTPPPPPTLVRL